MARKQQLIHFHGNVAPMDLASKIAKGEIIVLHPESGATQFGTLNNAGNAIVWFNDYASTQAYVKEEVKKVADRVTTLEGLTGTTNSALQFIEKGGDGDYVTTTVSEKANNRQSIGVAVKTQKVSEANATGDTKAMGLAEASDVKTYVEGKASDLEGTINAVSEVANAALKTVTGENAIVATTGESQSIKVSLKIDTGDTKGNVELTNGENGLSAKVVIPEDNVLGVTGDILSLGSNKLVNATVSIDYFTETAEGDVKGKKFIRLIGRNNIVLSKIDASDFIKDGMIDTVAFDEKTHILTLTFNTEAGKEPISIDLSTLVDTYKAGDGLVLGEDGTFSVTDAIARVGTATGETPDTKDSNTIVGVRKYAEDAVTTAKGTIDAYTVNGKAISGNPTLDATNIKVAGNTENSDKTVNAAVEDLYTKVNAAASGGVLSLGGLAGHITLKADGTSNGSVNLKTIESGGTKTISAEIVGLGSAAFTESTAYDKAGAAAGVLGTTADTKEMNTVYGVQAYVKEVKQTLNDKNVSAGVPEGETLVSASANANKVTVSSTEQLKTAVTKAGSAVQDVKVNNTDTNKIVVSKFNENVVTINIDNMVIDCGEF